MQGVVVLMLSQVIIKIVGLIYKLYLTNKQGFGDRGNAIYSAAFQIYALFLTISSVGVPNSISKLVSSKVAVGDNKGAYRIFKIAFALFGILGFVGSSILFLGAEIIANKYKYNIKWIKRVFLDNVGKFYFFTNKSKIPVVFRYSVSLKEVIDKETLQHALNDILKYFSNFNCHLKKEYFGII